MLGILGCRIMNLRLFRLESLRLSYVERVVTTVTPGWPVRFDSMVGFSAKTLCRGAIRWRVGPDFAHSPFTVGLVDLCLVQETQF